MGKRIIQQRRGRGTNTYKVNKKKYIYKLQLPRDLSGEGTVLKLIDSGAHSSPIAKVQHQKGIFYIPAFNKMIEGQKIKFHSKEIASGNIETLENIPIKTKIYCIELNPKDGGKIVKSGGNSATVNRIIGEYVFVLLPSKKEKKLNKNCRAIIGVAAGAGRVNKPIMKAGKNYHIKKTKNKLYPRTSAIKMNAIDHPFGSGRGKNPKSKIAKRNAPPGRKVGLLRPKRTGKKK